MSTKRRKFSPIGDKILKKNNVSSMEKLSLRTMSLIVAHAHVGWKFCLLWVLASNVGLHVGGGISAVVGMRGAVGGAIGGIGIGIMQQLVMREWH